MRIRGGSLLLAAAFLCCRCGLLFFPDLSGIVTCPSRQGQVLEPGEEIFIAFDFAVDHLAAEKLFRVEGAEGEVPGRKAWTGDRLELVPEPELQYGGRYLLRCQGQVWDKKGNPYPLNIEILFFYRSDRELPPELTAMSPPDGGIIAGSDPLTIRFSKAMDRLSFSEGFSLSPDTEHRLLWNPEATEVTVQAEEEWENLQLYRVSLGRTIKDTVGIPLARGLEATFSVETDVQAPAVEAVYPAVNDWAIQFPPTGETMDGIAYTDVIRIVFSEPMDEGSTEEAFSLEPEVAGALAWLDAQVLLFIPETGYDMATAYRAAVRASAQDRKGNALAQDAVYRFTTNRNIPILELSSIQAIKDTTLLMSPPYGTAQAVDLDPGGGIPDYTYEFLFTFSSGLPTPEEQLRAQRAIGITAAFPTDSSPWAIGHTWLSETVLSATFRGFNSEAASEHYYVLEIAGGPEGVRNNRGSHLSADIRQLLRTRE